MLGSDTPTCNFPGKIPDGLDLPSDVVDVQEASKNGETAPGLIKPQIWG